MASLIAILSLGKLFVDAVRAPVRTETFGANVQRTARDAFDGLYQVAWRGDGTAGNTAIEAVYYFPSLRESLRPYDERSFIQAQTLQAIDAADPSLYPFVIRLEHATDLDQELALQEHATLIADSTVVYRPVRWQPFTLFQEAKNSLVGIFFFERPAGSPAPRQLTLTMKGLPGNQRPSTFSWDLDVLRLAEES